MRHLHYLFFFLTLTSSIYSDSLALTAIFRNEGRFLKEWIEYYRLIGVGKFYLTNHLSTDNYREVLNPYLEEGIVELRDEPLEIHEIDDWKKIVVRAYNWGIYEAKKQYTWLIVVDIDEFLVPKGESLSTILEDYTSYGAVAVNWQIFGTSNVGKIPDDKLLVETLLLKAKTDFIQNHHTKLIVQPKCVWSFIDPHRCRLNSPYETVDMGENKMKTAQMTAKIFNERLQLNHYWAKDEEFYRKEKLSRKEIWGEWFDSMEVALTELNEETDEAILPFIPALKKQMGL